MHLFYFQNKLYLEPVYDMLMVSCILPAGKSYCIMMHLENKVSFLSLKTLHLDQNNLYYRENENKGAFAKTPHHVMTGNRVFESLPSMH